MTLILAAVMIAGWLLSPDSPRDTGATLDVETDASGYVAPTPMATPRSVVTEPQHATNGDSDQPVEDAAVSASASPQPTEIPGEWRDLADLPAGWGHTTVWTGSELVFWGGGASTEARHTLSAEGVAYDPGEDSWRPIAPAPLEARYDAAGSWTGREMLIWGGTGASTHLADGAAYDPAADSWRPLAASPLSPRAGSATAWSGGELLVIAGSDNVGPLGDAAAYDPMQDSWRPLSEPPPELERMWRAQALWAGDAAVVWSGDWDAVDGLRYSVGDDRWEPLPMPTGRGSRLLQVLWSGQELFGLIASDGDRLAVRTLAPGSAGWQELPDRPNLAASGTTAVWSDSGLVLLTTSPRHWMYEPVRQAWLRLPDAPSLGLDLWQAAVWTGSELIVWGESPDGTGTKGAIFRFASPTGSLAGPSDQE